MYTGHLFEEEVLGHCLWHWDRYLPFGRCLQEVKAHQPWDPTDPNPRAANDLHFFVAEDLGVNCSEVKLFTAIGTPLDRFHGVDAFLEYQGRIVTIDLTCNGMKDEHKADLIIHEEDVYQGDGRVNQLRLQEIATQAARLLKGRAA